MSKFGTFALYQGDICIPIRTEMFEIDPEIIFSILNDHTPVDIESEETPFIYRRLHEWYHGRTILRSMSVGDWFSMESKTDKFVWVCENDGWTTSHERVSNES